MEEIEIKKLIPPLVIWYQNNHRDLPWRGSRNPYHIWVSEIMLQQTRVEAVIPYYHRFLEALPDISALASCEEDRLLKLWEGLGYYSRARNLQKAGKQIVKRHHGQMPQTYEEILDLSGIGPYTAGAIGSIAFGLNCPAVDGNVLRVFARVSDDATDILSSGMKRRVTEQLQAAMDGISAEGSGEINQALMELGACVCLPNGKPKCEECPWKEECLALARDTTESLPVRIKKTKRRIEQRTILVVDDGRRVLLHKRPERGLLAGMYELPNIEEILEEQQVVKDVKRLGLKPVAVEKLPDAKHLFSHIEWDMTGFLVRVEEADAFVSESVNGKKKTDSFYDGSPYFLIEKETARDELSIPSAFNAYLKYL